MVSFSCENCGDVLTKGKLDKHRGHCRGAEFTCLDCMVHFPGSSYKSHTSCMSEAQKYQGALYKGDKDRKGKQPDSRPSGAMIPRKAYVEDEVDTEMGDGTVAVVDVPPHAPSPPPPRDNDLPHGVNVLDFLVHDEGTSQGSSKDGAHKLATQPSTISDDSHFREHGFSYGNTPLQPGLERYQSFSSLVPHAGSQRGDRTDDSQHYRTPGQSRRDRGDDGRSDKKRKRGQGADDIDTGRAQAASSSGRPGLASGLTGGLSRLLSSSRHVDDFDRQAAPRSPLSSMKRSRKEEAERRGGERNGRSGGRRRADSSSSEDDRRGDGGRPKAIEYHRDGQANDGRQLIQYRTPGELFLNLVTKGKESERGMSINKVLKRYHRERGEHSDRDKETNDKELWKHLRLRRNSRDEIVLTL